MSNPQPPASPPRSMNMAQPLSSPRPISSLPVTSPPHETSSLPPQPSPQPFVPPLGTLPSSNPNRHPYDPTPPGMNAPSGGPEKIPFRPRKARKVAVLGCPAKQEAEDKADAGPATAAHRHPRPAYRLPSRPLSAQGEVAAAVAHLRAADPHLAQIIDAHEAPVFQSLHPPFHSLTRSILYQQLAIKAASSIYARFISLCGGEEGVVPEVVLSLSTHQLRQIGVSSRKASYLHDLANKYRSGILSDSSIVAMDDKSLFTMLNMVKGIGAWSVHMFMIFSLHRPDVLPVGDVGVRKGVQLLYSLDALPRPSQMDHICERWRPYRSVGSWYMWRLVEAKGMPAALATASSSGGTSLMLPPTSATGGGGAGPLGPPPPPLAGVSSSALVHLRQQVPPQQHPHLHLQQQQSLRQHQHQLQLQSQLVDAIHSIANLG